MITSGTTEAINLVAHAWGRANLGSRDDAIVLTEMEHHSDIVPWQMLAEERGIELTIRPRTRRFHTRYGSLCCFAWKMRKLVCVVHTSNVLRRPEPA